jgi:tape measure domain-containing protein
MLESGKLVHKIGFDIDSKSWRNLKNFQNRISMLKQQMKGLNGAVDFKLNATGFRQQATKAARIRAEVESKIPSIKPDVMAKREQRITNLRNRLDYQMKKGGVGIQSSTAFMNGGFAKAAEGFRKTGDISAFSQQVSLASRKMIDSAKSAKTMGRSIHDMRSTIVAATAAYTAFSALQNTAMVGMNLESMQAGMKIFAGSDSAVAGEMDYIIGVSDRLGLSLMDAAEQYNKFSIVSKDKLTSSQRKDLFEGFSEYATVLQTTPERYQRGMMALQQMMSKGKLSSEELRLQLAENIPGSVQIFAKALNMSEAEMFKQMEMGKILSADIMPAVAKEFARSAREGGALEAATKKTRAELNRFKNALIEVQNAIFTGGMGEGLAGFFKLTSALLKDLKPLATYIGKVLKWAFLGFAQALNIVAAPLRLASNLFSLLDENAKEFVAGGSILAAAGAWIYLSKAIRGVTMAQLGLLKSSKLLAAVPWIAAALVAEDVIATVATDGKANTMTKSLLEYQFGEGNKTTASAALANMRSGSMFATAAYSSKLIGESAGGYIRSIGSGGNKVEVKIDATGLNDKQIDYRVNQSMSNAITDIAGESGN